MDTPTIAAVATPAGPGGIGIIKISGTRAFPIAMSIFRQKKSHLPSSPLLSDQVSTHHLYYGSILNPETGYSIDEALVAFMKAPHSYTTEDVVEIQVHSGQAVLMTILNLVLRSGAELAGPGEFTRRAFMNGRIDLTQAEAVIDLIHSRTSKSVEAAASLLSGDFKICIDELRFHLCDVLSRIEASIDFPDEVEEIESKSVSERLASCVLDSILNLIQRYEDCRVIRDGFKISIIGRPNVGKSSLMNWLIKKERSIVTDIPGTTRDVVEDVAMFRGIPVCLADTAGIHITHDAVELLGIEKTFESIRSSDLILLIIDAAAPDFEPEMSLLDKTGSIPVVLVLNKIDLIGNRDNISLSERFPCISSIAVSVKNEIHLDVLVDLIIEQVFKKSSVDDREGFIPNVRHARALEKSADFLLKAIAGIDQAHPFEIIAMDLRDAIGCIDEISGKNVSDEILDHIFNSFCIGK